MLPHDPAVLYSYVNTCLRDEGCTLEELCACWDISPEELKRELAAAGFAYDRERRRFF